MGSSRVMLPAIIIILGATEAAVSEPFCGTEWFSVRALRICVPL